MDQGNTFSTFKQAVEKMRKARVVKSPSNKHLWDIVKGVHVVKGFSDGIKVGSLHLRINRGRISKVLI